MIEVVAALIWDNDKFLICISHACDMEVGKVFIANGWEKPDVLCQSAWDSA